MIEEEYRREVTAELNVHIFSVSAAMVGVCLTVVGIIGIIISNNSEYATIADDLLALDTGDVRLEGLHGDAVLDAFVFAGRDGLVTDLWSAGRHIVRAGQHSARDAVADRFRATLRRLRDAL